MRSALLVGVFALAFAVTVGLGGSNGQDPKQPPKVEPKAKGFLPQNWGALGLTAEAHMTAVKALALAEKLHDDPLAASIRARLPQVKVPQ